MQAPASWRGSLHLGKSPISEKERFESVFTEAKNGILSDPFQAILASFRAEKMLESYKLTEKAKSKKRSKLSCFVFTASLTIVEAVSCASQKKFVRLNPLLIVRSRGIASENWPTFTNHAILQEIEKHNLVSVPNKNKLSVEETEAIFKDFKIQLKLDRIWDNCFDFFNAAIDRAENHLQRAVALQAIIFLANRAFSLGNYFLCSSLAQALSERDASDTDCKEAWEILKKDPLSQKILATWHQNSEVVLDNRSPRFAEIILKNSHLPCFMPNLSVLFKRLSLLDAKKFGVEANREKLMQKLEIFHLLDNYSEETFSLCLVSMEDDLKGYAASTQATFKMNNNRISTKMKKARKAMEEELKQLNSLLPQKLEDYNALLHQIQMLIISGQEHLQPKIALKTLLAFHKIPPSITSELVSVQNPLLKLKPPESKLKFLKEHYPNLFHE